MTRRSDTTPSLPTRILPMMRAVSLSKILQAVLHAMAAVLLFMSVAAPAMAEIGCAQEASIHLENDRGAVGVDIASDGQSQPEDESGAPRGHCAFSHGHCAGIAAVNAGAARRLLVGPAYALATAKPLAPGAVETPHHPPNA